MSRAHGRAKQPRHTRLVECWTELFGESQRYETGVYHGPAFPTLLFAHQPLLPRQTPGITDGNDLHATMIHFRPHHGHHGPTNPFPDLVVDFEMPGPPCLPRVRTLHIHISATWKEQSAISYFLWPIASAAS